MTLDPNLPWYLARGAGFVAWGLVAVSVIWGLAFSGKFARRRPPAAWVLDLHRFMGGTAVVFTAIHILALSADRYTDFGPAQLAVPLVSSYRPVAVAWGIIAFWLLVAVEGTSLAMSRLPRRWWRAVHLTSFAVFALSTVHGFSTGTDSHRFVRVMFIVTAAMVGGLILARLVVPMQRARRSGRLRQVPAVPSHGAIVTDKAFPPHAGGRPPVGSARTGDRRERPLKAVRLRPPPPPPRPPSETIADASSAAVVSPLPMH